MKSKKMRAIEDEYGEPFWDVVKGYAGDGETVSATGAILGYHPAAFRKLIKRHGLNHWFKSRTEANTITRPSTPAVVAAREKGVIAMTAYKRAQYAIDHNGISDTIRGHAKRAGVSEYTVRNRLRSGRSLADALKKTSYVTQPSNAGHFWRSRAV